MREQYAFQAEALQAANEALKATNEELEISKEELHTINEELKVKVEEATQISTNLQNLVNSTDIGTIFLDHELRVQLFTPAARALFHLIPADEGRPLADISHRLRDVDVLAEAEVVLASLQSSEREVRTRDDRAYVLRVLPYRDGAGRMGGVVLTFFEITERMRVERTLAEQARLLDLSNDAIIVRDVNNRIQYWNRGATELYGWTREKAIGQDLHTLLQTEFEVPFAQLIAALRKQERLEGEVVQVTRDGRRLTVLCRWALDRDAAGRPGSILTTTNDITERKRMEEALRASERDFRALFEGSSVGKAQVDSVTGRLLRANAALCALTGYREAELLALTLDDLTHPEDRNRERFEQWVQGQASYQLEQRYVRKDGRRVWGHVTGNVIPAADGQPVRTIVVIQDITARVQAELALRELNATLAERLEAQTAVLREREEHLRVANAELTRSLKLKDEFLAMMSHELRTPLNIILGFTEALTEELYGPILARQREALSSVAQSGRHLLALLSDILDLARIASGHESLELQPIDVSLLCKVALGFVLPAAQARGIQLRHIVEHPISELQADQRRLTQILVNLLGNAVKFTPDGGTVGLEVSVDAAQEHIQFSVWDTGIGIAAADQTRLFEPFTQLDGKLSRQYEGVGLGLALARRLVELHDGSISLASTPGQGSRFTVSLPWAAADNLTP